jgi:hypothetical protein
MPLGNLLAIKSSCGNQQHQLCQRRPGFWVVCADLKTFHIQTIIKRNQRPVIVDHVDAALLD